MGHFQLVKNGPIDWTSQSIGSISALLQVDRSYTSYNLQPKGFTNGKLYMIKIVPDAGPPYYLLDTDGDGNMDVRRSDLEKGAQVPQWVIFSW